MAVMCHLQGLIDIVGDCVINVSAAASFCCCCYDTAELQANRKNSHKIGDCTLLQRRKCQITRFCEDFSFCYLMWDLIDLVCFIHVDTVFLRELLTPKGGALYTRNGIQ
jgi:hypothetical protein